MSILLWKIPEQFRNNSDESSKLTFTSDADIILIISLADSTPDITLLAKVSARISGVASEVSRRKAFLAACNSSSDTVRLLNWATTSDAT